MTAMRVTKTDETSVDGIPIVTDPVISKVPRNLAHLGFKERYSLPSNYVRPVLRKVIFVKPLSVGIFGGRLEYFKLKWYQVLFMFFFIHVKAGGSPNWTFIQQWAAEIRPKLEK